MAPDNKTFAPGFCVCLGLLTASLFASPVLQIEPVPDTEPEKNAPRIPWVSGEEQLPARDQWLALPLSSDDGAARAVARVILTDTAFHLDAEVADETHVSSRGGAELWAGDSLQIALDLSGDGSGSSDPGARGPFGPDDMALGIALTKNGAEGWLFFRDARLGRPGPLPEGLAEVERDGDKKLTRYRLRLPWTLTGGHSPGLRPEMGIALLLNDYTDGPRSREMFTFGGGADGVPRPDLHARLRIGNPPSTYAAAQTVRNAEWSATEPAEVLIAAGGPSALTLNATLPGANPVRVDIPADRTIHRFRVRATALGDSVVPLTAVVGEGARPAVEISVPVMDAGTVLAAFNKRIGELLENPANHPLFNDHLRSLQALVLQEWARLQIYRPSNPELARRTLERIGDYTGALHGEVGDWQAYLDGRRSLLIGYLSPHDGTYQTYLLNLPKNWDPEKSYPLFFELHGAGDANPMVFPLSRLTLGNAAPELFGYDTPKVFAEMQRNGYWVHPFGRGNLGYRGIAETDIFEACDDAHRRFKIDPDRRYLYGFSMGGGGTWANALRTPDRWAAIAILAGAPRGDLGDKLVPNIAHLPVWIWCGEEDRLFPRTEAMVAALRAGGIEPVYSSSPGVGHSYLMEKQEACLNWLQTHTRKRPDSFQFYTDSDAQTSAWGIRLTRDATKNGLPGFKVRIDGSTVHLDSEGTDSLVVNPGAGGLGLQGDFTLVWNGREVYHGPVRNLRLAEAKATPI